MLSWKKDSAVISQDVPTFSVRYIGTTETFTPNGNGCTTQPLQRLWDNAPSERNLRKVSIALSVRGICMIELESKNGEGKSTRLFSMEDISFCAADKNVNDRLFCWISKDPLSGKLEAHAVLCSHREKAEAMSSILSRAFQLAYKDWAAERQREKRRQATVSVTLLEASSGSTSSEYVPPPNGRPIISNRRSSGQSMNMSTSTEEQVKMKKLSD